MNNMDFPLNCHAGFKNKNSQNERIKHLAINVVFCQLENALKLLDYNNSYMLAKSKIPRLKKAGIQRNSKNLLDLTNLLDSIKSSVLMNTDREMQRILRNLLELKRNLNVAIIPENEKIIRKKLPDHSLNSDIDMEYIRQHNAKEENYIQKFKSYFENDYQARIKKQQELFVTEECTLMIGNKLYERSNISERISTEKFCSHSALNNYYNQIQIFKEAIEAYIKKFEREDAIYEDKLVNLRNLIEKQQDRYKFCVEEIKRFHFEIARMILRLQQAELKPKPRYKKQPKKAQYPPEDETEDEQNLRIEIMQRSIKLAKHDERK